MEPIQTFAFSFMIWRCDIFKQHFEQHGYALFAGKIGYQEVGNLSAIDVDYEEDLELVNKILRGKEPYKIEYYSD